MTDRSFVHRDLPLVIVPEEDGGALVLVDAEIAGERHRFLLDTGASGSCVGPDVPAIEDRRSAQATPSPGVFSAGEASHIVTLGRLILGPIARERVSVARVAHVPGRPTDNLIGMDILHTEACHFRFTEARVTIDPPERDRPVETMSLYLDRRHHPYVAVDPGDGSAGRAVWDTGASITVVDTAFVAAHAGCFTRIGQSIGTDATSATFETPLYRLESATIAGVSFAAHLIAAVDLAPVNATIADPMDLILGYTTLGQADWWMDFPGHRWTISRAPGR